MGGPLQTEGSFGIYQRISLSAFFNVYLCICKHTDERTFICSNQRADPQNGIKENSTLLDTDY